jgi:uncharacterized protein YjbI with pentapeptide repeats
LSTNRENLSFNFEVDGMFARKFGVWEVILGVAAAALLWIGLPVILSRFMDVPDVGYSEYILSERSNLSQLLSAVAIVLGLLIAADRVMVSFEGQVIARFDRAVENLASENRIVRLAALESIKVVYSETPNNREAIIGTLCAFVRQNSHRSDDTDPWLPGTLKGVKNIEGERHATHEIATACRTIVARDVAEGSALTKPDLSGANLRYLILAGGSLEGANLHQSDLSHAVITSGQPADNEQLVVRNRFQAKDVCLIGADLIKAKFHGVDLSGAQIQDADMTGTDFTYVKFSEAVGRPKSFKDAWFTKCDLRDIEFPHTLLADVKYIDDSTLNTLTSDQREELKERMAQNRAENKNG